MIPGIVASRRRGGGGVPTVEYPGYLGVTNYASVSVVDRHSIPLPAQNVGDLLVMHIALGRNRTIMSLAGWTAVGDLVTSSGNHRSGVYYMVSPATVGAGSVSAICSGTCWAAAQVHRFAAGSFNPSTPVIRHSAIGSGTTAPTPAAMAAGSPGFHRIAAAECWAQLYGTPKQVVTFPFIEGQSHAVLGGTTGAQTPHISSCYSQEPDAVIAAANYGFSLSTAWITETIIIPRA